LTLREEENRKVLTVKKLKKIIDNEKTSEEEVEFYENVEIDVNRKYIKLK
jgi:hypothetical protein